MISTTHAAQTFIDHFFRFNWTFIGTNKYRKAFNSGFLFNLYYQRTVYVRRDDISDISTEGTFTGYITEL